MFHLLDKSVNILFGFFIFGEGRLKMKLGFFPLGDLFSVTLDINFFPYMILDICV